MTFINLLFTVLLFFGSDLRAQEEKLTRDMALERFSKIKEVSYKLSVDVTGDEKTFYGSNLIGFSLSEPLSDIRLDFKNGKVIKLVINSQEITDFKKDNVSFTLPVQRLKNGKNEVLVEYSHNYSNNGRGLHRYKDNEDGNIYLYTHFEPQDASQFMPCFDQPDLKATYEFEATVPEPWTVISAKKEKQVLKAGEKKKKWIFAKTWPMSTYLFSFHAGPYKIWKAKADHIPLRFFARQSLAKHMDVGNWITYTKQGFSYFNNYFGYSYPFEKYDQVIVPEFNSGGMENIAAVTYSERMISRGKKTKQQKNSLASLILHEMAHMWFGNLVTMKWWDDLWLNETFASYMAYKALVEATEFSEAWKDFYIKDKNWAYISDQLPTTHPISTKVNSVDEAGTIFDGITYGKGASVIKQLAFFIGENDFQEGLQNYFKLHAFRNTTLQDFISALSQKTKQNLSAWSSTWLETSGVDTLSSRFECKGGKFEKLNLDITSATPEKPRTHAFNVVFLKEKRSRPQLIHTAIIKTSKNTEYTTAKLECPDIVFPNYEDNGYFKIHLDDVSLKNLKQGLSKTADPFLRIMFWDNLWQMVRDQKLTLQEYEELFQRNFLAETDLDNLSRILRTASGGWYNRHNSLYYFYPRNGDGSNNKRQELVKKLESLYLEQLKKSKPGSDEQQLWIDHLITATESKEGQKLLADWLDGKQKFTDLAEQPERRWTAVVKLCSLGYEQSLELLNKEKEKDNSEQAQRSVLACEASRPLEEIKKVWWQKITENTSSMSFYQQSSVMESFYGPGQKTAYGTLFSEDYFKILSNNLLKKDESFLSRFAAFMGPNDCDESRLSSMKNFLNTQTSLIPGVKKTLLEIISEDERCQKIRAQAHSKL